MNLPNKILLVEDVEDIRAWLADLLREAFGAAEIAEAATVAQAYGYLNEQFFDLVVFDLHLPDGNGLDVLARVKSQETVTHCVVATAYDDDAHLMPALNAGADGYLLKDQPGEQLIRDLLGILNGAPPLSPPVAKRIMQLARQATPDTLRIPLTAREEEVLTYIAKGYSRIEIGQTLQVSAHTIASHVNSIYSKLDISSRAEAAVEAVRRGLINP